jgi:hypothetical protein
MVAAGLFGGQIALTVFLLFYNKTDIEETIKQDCLIFDRKKVTPDEHFLKADKTNAKIEPVKVPKEDLNTSRNFKAENDEANLNNPDVLILKENINNSENITIENKTDLITAHNNNNNNNEAIRNNYLELNPSQEVQTVTETKNNKNTIHQVTMRDYESLTLNERLTYDNRALTTYLKDTIIRYNLVISSFYKDSIVDPSYIRVAKLFFLANLIFTTNSILFTEDYIELRASNDNRVSLYLNLGFNINTINYRINKNNNVINNFLVACKYNLFNYLYSR